MLDGIGGFTSYGVIDNFEASQAENALPMGLSQGCRLKRDIAKDEVIRSSDVDIPQGRVCDQLRAEQNQYFSSAVAV